MNGKIMRGVWRVERSPKAEGRRRKADDRLSASNDQRSTFSSPLPPSTFHLRYSPFRRAFTLVELLVTITIIGIIAGMSLGGMQMARRAAAEAKTKATIAKLDAIIQQRVEAFTTRRLPITIPPGMPPKVAAQYRLFALRDLMRMEMPDRLNDITTASNNPKDIATLYPVDGSKWSWPQGTKFTQNNMTQKWFVELPNGVSMYIPYKTPVPAVTLRYYQKSISNPSNPPTNDFNDSKMLYLFIMSDPANMEQFSQNEISIPGTDGWPVFVDGWGRPIRFLRWAPGYSNRTDLGFNGLSEIQTGDPNGDHDPFDSRHVDPVAFKLIPLILSAGPDGQIGETNGVRNVLGTDLNVGENIDPKAQCYSPCADTTIGSVGGSGAYDNITNHQTDMR